MTLKTSEKKSLQTKESNLPLSKQRITASMIKCYKKCPKLFYYQYIMGFRLPTKGIPLVFGDAFHQGIEAFYKNEDPVAKFKEMFKEDGIRGIRKDPVIKQKFLENYNDGVYLMEAWKQDAPKIHALYNISKNVKNEVGFEVNWPHPENPILQLPIPFTGRFDGLTDTHQILEFKTSNKPYKQEDVDKLDQTSIYNYTYFLMTGTWPTEIIYVVFIKGRKKDPIQVLKTSRSKESITETYKMVEEMLLTLVQGGRNESSYKYGEDFLHKYCDCKLYEEVLLL